MSVILLFSNAATPSLTVDTVPVTQRVQRATGTSIDLQITQDGTPTDTDDQTATVTITRDDGTPIVTDATATREATGHYTYFLTSAQTAQLDWLTATWTSHHPTPNHKRDDPHRDRRRVPHRPRRPPQRPRPHRRRQVPHEQAHADARTYAEQELEQACGVAFVPRYGR
jgi:hypothetical protein